MATVSWKDNVLLGYNHPISAPQSPDIDFHDVFGGPPRRASVQDIRSSFGETKDSFELRSKDETISQRRHRWSGLGEKPVFGEEGVNRRRITSDDFFDDIFRGNDSTSSSPKDPFNSNPSSRVLSPCRPVSPRVPEPDASLSLPSQFSLPGKLINHHKNKDGVSNGLFPPSPLSRFSSQVQEESRNTVSSKSSLSQHISLSSDESPSLEQSEEVKKDRNLKKDSTDSQVPSAGHQFHFSIYKWASKGVPFPLSFRGGYKSKTKERFKLERCSSGSGRIACEGFAKESPTRISNKIDGGSGTFSATVSSDANSREIEFDNTKNRSNVNVVKSKPVEEAVLPDNSNFPGFKAEKGRISASIQEAPKNNIKTIRSLILGDNEVKKSEESKVKGTKKLSVAYDFGEEVNKRDEKRMTLNHVETDKPNAQGTPTNSQDIPANNRAKGKIKDFVKIFDQESSDKSKLRDNSQRQSFRGKERGKFKTQDDQCLPTPRKYEDLPITSTAAATEKVDAISKKPEKPGSQVKTNDYKATNISSRSNVSSASTAATIPNDSEARDGYGADSCIENIQIKELTQVENEQQQAGNSLEEIQDIDAKIRKWSQGKQGNIRSLLSTLQYVLWSESGWKPVPLVDIIEGNAVKRSYQKALLSLHPDKLQQKGATSQQKYIAEKVFDILQEAWTQFNSLGLV